MKRTSGAILRNDEKVTWSPDGVLSETWSPRLTVTEHPVEDGTKISDHVQVLPLEWTMECIVTETPLEDQTSRVELGTLRITDEIEGPDRLTTAFEFLKDCQRKFLTVATLRWGDIDSVVMTGWAHALDKQQRVVFSIGFKRVQIAYTGRGAVIPKRTKVAGAPPPEECGQAATTDGTEQDESWAHWLGRQVGYEPVLHLPTESI